MYEIIEQKIVNQVEVSEGVYEFVENENGKITKVVIDFPELEIKETWYIDSVDEEIIQKEMTA